jgi:hypothetical protein
MPLPRILLACLLLLALPGVVEACPSCKAALATQEGGQGNLVQGFFWSILFLLSMPAMIVGGLSTYMYALVRKARRAGHARPGQPFAQASPRMQA